VLGAARSLREAGIALTTAAQLRERWSAN